MRNLTLAWATMLLASAVPATAQDAPPAMAVPMATPETVGMSSAKLARIGDAMDALVEEKKLAGVVTLVAHKGKVVHLHATGKRDLGASDALKADSIFRIASMTKPITGVAMMMLWEQGRWKLDDPVSKYIPEFADLKVKAADGSLVAPAHAMTMRELMSHSAGFDVSAGYEDAKLSETDLQGMIDKLAKLPLADQPGTDWNYGPSVNIQGYIVEKLSGMSLDRFFEQRIFTPLGMVDTQFWVAPEKAGRVTPVNGYQDGAIVPLTPALPVVTAKPRFLAGSGGLYSTAPDYWRFAQMLENGGDVRGQATAEARDGQADGDQRPPTGSDGGPLRPQGGRHRLRAGLRGGRGSGGGQDSPGQGQLLLGRCLWHMVLDRSGQGHHHGGHDPKHPRIDPKYGHAGDADDQLPIGLRRDHRAEVSPSSASGLPTGHWPAMSDAAAVQMRGSLAGFRSARRGRMEAGSIPPAANLPSAEPTPMLANAPSTMPRR